MTETAARPCPICERNAPVAYEERIDPALISEYTFASRKRPELMHYEYRECQSCDLLFTSQLPDAGDLLNAYHDAAFDSATESEYAARTYARALDGIIQPGMSVLDVGCGDGTFLMECLNRGASAVRGIEPSPAAADLASPILRGQIFIGGHESFTDDSRYDLITLFQTIEHIRDPLEFFHEMFGFARPGGYLAVACHDYRSPVNRVLKDKSPIFDIEHLQVYSQTSIRKAMEAVGLKVISSKPYANSYPVSYWMRLAPVPAKVKEAGLVRRGRLGRVPLTLRVGNLMTVGQFPS